MSLALYRKYRPRTFAEVIGQEHVTEPLMQALRSGRLNHAYLFSGPRGCGKTSSARILARSLNCAQGPTPEPCGSCDSCVALAPDGPGSIDVIEIDAASHGGVDDARDLRERAAFAPVSSRFKVYVIDEAHMVSSAGFNALLKLVEEPPEYVKFVFATTEPEKVLGTIRSRTHHYPFRLVPPSVLRPHLDSLCRSEGVTVEPSVLPLVVRAGAGSVRDSLSVLDQLIAGAGAEGVKYARAVALLGVTDVALIDEMCDALAAGDGASVFAIVDSVVEAGHEPRRFTGDLLTRLRDLIVLQQVPDAIAKGLLDGAEDELARMAAQAQRFGPATLSRMADTVHDGLTQMRGTTAPRLLLELVCARMLLPEVDSSGPALLARLERMERRLGSGQVLPQPEPGAPVQPPSAPVVRPAAVADVPAAPVPPVSTPAAPPSAVAETQRAPMPEPTAVVQPDAEVGAASDALAPGGLDAAGVRRNWDDIVTQVRRRKQRAAAVLGEATVREVLGDTIVLLFKHAFHANAVSAEPQFLVDALHEVLGGAWKVRCEVSGDGGRASAAAGGPPGPQTRGGPPVSGPSASGPGVSAPGGSAAGGFGGVPAGQAVAPGGADDSWPTTAPLGGPAPESGGPSAVMRSIPAPAQGRGRAGETGAARSQDMAVAAARRAATMTVEARSGAAGGGTSVGGSGRPVTSSAQERQPGTDDTRVPDPRGYEGFDPGDEPLDESTEHAVRHSSEEQALDLLRQTLGAEKIV